MVQWYEGRFSIRVAGNAVRVIKGVDSNYTTMIDYIQNGKPLVVAQWAITADEGNVGDIVIGGEFVDGAVATRQGFHAISPGQRYVFQNIDITQLWADSPTTDNAAYFGFWHDLDA